jgi:CRISPR/Cas system-associated exonuclease Cas4 (RecB family)
LVVDRGDALVVTDFKTSRSRWSPADVDSSAGQLLLYGELLRRQLDRPVELQFAVLTKTKQPDLQIHPVVGDSSRVQRQQAMIRRVWRSIQGGHFYPHPSAMNCPTCPFQTVCAVWSG